ncbi:MAG: hypothetical protein GOP50_10590 [Candidatus Heimdallarchaeota archaeon]|nr:hypothetical protein [Candidatus Heimdallarchaeota archaeon]
MNRTSKFLTLIVMGVLVTSILFSDLSKAVIVSDQLTLVAESYVDGKILYTNTTHTDLLIGYSTILVEKIFTPTDIPDEMVLIKYSWDAAVGQNVPITFYEDQQEMDFTYLVFYDNRTTVFMGIMKFADATESVEVNAMQGNTLEGFLEVNNTVITYGNGTSYVYGDVQPADPVYDEIQNLMFGFYLIGYGLGAGEYAWTPFGISPLANVNDDVHYSTGLGKVIDKPAVITTTGDSYDAIHVEYYDTSLYGFWDAPEMHCFYEASTGILLKVYETDGTETWDFLPGHVVLEPPTTTPTPYSLVGIVTGLVVIGLITVYIRRRK